MRTQVNVFIVFFAFGNWAVTFTLRFSSGFPHLNTQNVKDNYLTSLKGLFSFFSDLGFCFQMLFFITFTKVKVSFSCNVLSISQHFYFMLFPLSCFSAFIFSIIMFLSTLVLYHWHKLFLICSDSYRRAYLYLLSLCT